MDRQKEISKAKEISRLLEEEAGLGGQKVKQRQRGKKRAKIGYVGPEMQVHETMKIKTNPISVCNNIALNHHFNKNVRLCQV